MSSPPDDINQAFDQLELEDTTTTTNASAPFRTSLAELQAAPDPRANWRPRRGRRERPRLPPAWIEHTPQPQLQPQRLDLEYVDDETLVRMGILDPPVDQHDAASKQPEQPEQPQQADLLGYADDETLMEMGILYPPTDQHDAGATQGGQTEQAEQAVQTEQAGQAEQERQPRQPQQAKKAKKAKKSKKARQAKKAREARQAEKAEQAEQTEQAEQGEQAEKAKQAKQAEQAEKSGQPESSTHAARRGDKSPARTRNCVVCLQDKDILDTTPLLCGHDICSGCMNDFFEKSLVDESIFPPQCCTKPIPLDRARIVLKEGLVEKFEKMRVEIETINRTYCHVPDCRTFIDPATIAGVVGICPECEATTCTMCKHPAHSGPCADDPDTRAVLDMALRNGWKRCYNCSCVVERQGDGCEHMICILCNVVFCYDCEGPWTPEHHRGNHEDGRAILSDAHAFPAIVTEPATEAGASGIEAPLDEEEEEDDGYDGDDDDEDAVGELIDVYFDPGDSSPEHVASQGKIDGDNQSPEDSDSDEDVFYDAVEYLDEEDDSDEDVFYDAVEYLDEEDDSDEDVFYDAVEYLDEEEKEKEKEEENADPIGEPVREPGDEPFEAGVEEQGEEYVEDIDNPLESEGDADSEGESEESEAESETEEISDNDETAQRVLDGLGYNCEHNGWMDAHSPGRCGDCTKELRGWGWICLQCELVVCTMCRIFIARDAVRRGR